MFENSRCRRRHERAAMNAPRYAAATRERVLKLASASAVAKTLGFCYLKGGKEVTKSEFGATAYFSLYCSFAKSSAKAR